MHSTECERGGTIIICMIILLLLSLTASGMFSSSRKLQRNSNSHQQSVLINSLAKVSISQVNLVDETDWKLLDNESSAVCQAGVGEYRSSLTMDGVAFEFWTQRYVINTGTCEKNKADLCGFRMVLGCARLKGGSMLTKQLRWIAENQKG